MSCQLLLGCFRPKQSSVPLFLVPAFSSAQSLPARCLSTTPPVQSRVGSSPLSVPPEVSINFIDLPQTQTRGRRLQEVPKMAIKVRGPLGEITHTIPPFVTIAHDEEARKAKVTVQDPTIAHQRAMWGTTRAHLRNHILGVSEGHVCILSLVGVGYRASVESSATTVSPEYDGQQFVSLKVGYSHPIELGVPRGVKASTPQPTRILLEGVDRNVVTEFAAKIRQWRKPEPYKGKGIFVNNETIRLKAKKIK